MALAGHRNPECTWWSAQTTQWRIRRGRQLSMPPCDPIVFIFIQFSRKIGQTRLGWLHYPPPFVWLILDPPLALTYLKGSWCELCKSVSSLFLLYVLYSYSANEFGLIKLTFSWKNSQLNTLEGCTYFFRWKKYPHQICMCRRKMGDWVVLVLVPSGQAEWQSTPWCRQFATNTGCLYGGLSFHCRAVICMLLTYTVGDPKSMVCGIGPCPRTTLTPQVPYTIRAHGWLYGRQCMDTEVVHVWGGGGTCSEISSQQLNLILNHSEVCGPGQWGIRSDVDDLEVRD